jgi:hypothetical protein
VATKNGPAHAGAFVLKGNSNHVRRAAYFGPCQCGGNRCIAGDSLEGQSEGVKLPARLPSWCPVDGAPQRRVAIVLDEYTLPLIFHDLLLVAGVVVLFVVLIVRTKD